MKEIVFAKVVGLLEQTNPQTEKTHCLIILFGKDMRKYQELGLVNTF